MHLQHQVVMYRMSIYKYKTVSPYLILYSRATNQPSEEVICFWPILIPFVRWCINMAQGWFFSLLLFIAPTLSFQKLQDLITVPKRQVTFFCCPLQGIGIKPPLQNTVIPVLTDHKPRAIGMPRLGINAQIILGCYKAKHNKAQLIHGSHRMSNRK